MASAMLALDLTADFDKALSYALGAIGEDQVKLKNEQELAVRHTFEGFNVFLWLPTGFGKSLCYECLLFLFDFKLGRTGDPHRRSVVLVISPLVSLMTDQVASLRKEGYSCCYP